MVLSPSLLLAALLQAPADIPRGSAELELDLDGARLTVFTYKPESYRGERMLLVFHGVLRNADEYRDHAKGMGDRFGALIVAPRFDLERFPTWRYQRGGIVGPDGKVQDPKDWTYALVPKIAAAIRAREQQPGLKHWIIGHSAGGQFAMRMSAFMDTGAERIVAGNPGTDLFPTRAMEFGLGFGKLPERLASDEQLRKYLAAPLTIYLGTADNKPDEYFDQGPESMQQGGGRWQRGTACFAAGQKLAQDKGWTFGWRLVEAPGIGHDHDQMFDHPQCVVALFGEAAASQPVSQAVSQPASRPQSQAAPESRKAERMEYRGRFQDLRGAYRSAPEEHALLVGADAVQQSCVRLLETWVELFEAERQDALVDWVDACAAAVQKAGDLKGPRRKLLGAFATAHRLFAVRGPLEVPEDLRADVDAEVADVLAARTVTPRFVTSWDPATPNVDWRVATPGGMYAGAKALVQDLFRGSVYLRHLAPDVAAVLAECFDQRRGLPEAWQRNRELDVASQLLYGPPVREPWSLDHVRGTLVPWTDPPDAQALRDSLARDGDGLEPLPRLIRCLGLVGEPPCDSFRGGWLGGLRHLVGDAPGDWLGPAFTGPEWQAHRRDAAAWGYCVARAFEELASRGPVTGIERTPEGMVFVEPVPAFYQRMAGALRLLRGAALAARQPRRTRLLDLVTERLDFVLDLQTLCEAQAGGQPGPGVLHDWVRKAVRSDLLGGYQRTQPSPFHLDLAGRHALRQGPARLVELEVEWRGKPVTAFGGVVTTEMRWPGSGDAWVPGDLAHVTR